MLILMGDLPFPEQKERGSKLGGGNKEEEGRDSEESREEKLQLGYKINK